MEFCLCDTIKRKCDFLEKRGYLVEQDLFLGILTINVKGKNKNLPGWELLGSIDIDLNKNINPALIDMIIDSLFCDLESQILNSKHVLDREPVHYNALDVDLYKEPW